MVELEHSCMKELRIINNKRINIAVHIPDLANGNITSAEIAKQRLEETGVDAIMIGRLQV